MPWVRLDDRFPSHRKVALLTDRAFRLHVSAICWCAENLTDGRISNRELAVVAHVRNVKATAQQLEDAGLWDRTDDGWEIHDYLDYNPSREQVIAERKKNAARQEAFRRRKNGKPVPPDGSDNPSSNGVSNGVTQGGESRDGDATATRRKHDGDTTATGRRSLPDDEPQVNAFRNAVTNGAPTRPDPNPISMADVEERVTGSTARAEQRPEGRPAPIDDADFHLTDTMRRWVAATYPALDVDYVTAQFISHYRATGGRRQSWPDAWQKWVRSEAKHAAERTHRAASPTQGAFLVPLPGGQQPNTPRRSTTDDRVAQAIEAGRRLQALADAQRAQGQP